MSISSYKPVFHHALWRSCSSAVWAAFRQNKDLRCFYEPFHESLAYKTEADQEKSWRKSFKNNHHGDWGGHYFKEFPYARHGGVPHYKIRFAMDRFAMQAGDSDPEAQTYIESLLEYAREKEQIPFLQFNRGYLRGQWFKTSWPESTHLYQVRNLGEVFRSSQSMRYYVPAYRSVLAQNASDPLFEGIADYAGIECKGINVNFESVAEFKGALKRSIRQTKKWDAQKKQDVVAFFWALGLLASTRYADALIDIDGMREKDGAAQKEAEVSSLIGTWVDFSSIAPRSETIGLIAVSRDAKAIIRQAAERLDYSLDRLQALGAHGQTQAQLDAVIG